MSEVETLLARHDYAIVDRTIIGAEDWHDALPLQDIVPRDLENDVGRAPKLLPLEEGAPHMDRLAENLEAAREGREEYLFSCLLSAPDTPPNKMMIHLRDHIVFDPPYKGLLRFYDGRVFPHLLRMLREPTLRALFGPVSLWTFRLLDNWYSVPPPDTDSMRRYWVLHEKELERVNWIYQINQVLAKWQRQHKRPWKDLDEYHALSEQIEQALLKAQNEARSQDAGEQNAFALREIEAHCLPGLAGHR
ncbi:MAG: hypothetical protein FWD67_12790 [Betaproteobacteria bacterium]|nr:hypothetical protein [Betaproteobacteria bacterium]